MTTENTGLAVPERPGAVVADDADQTDTGLGKPLNQGADAIDRVVNLAPKWTLFVLGACVLLVIGAIVWAFYGSVTTALTAKGIFKDNGYLPVAAQADGTVSEIPAELGQEVDANDVLIKFKDGTTLVAPKDGWVASLFVAPGSKLLAGSTAVALTDYSIPDVVMTLLPASMTGSVVAGLQVELDVQSAPSTEYGYLTGSIVEVSSTPLTTDEVAEILDLQPEVVAQALGSQPGLLAVVGLDPDPTTPTKYSWTVGQGPPFAITNGTPAQANVILSRQPPIDVIFPGLSDGSNSG